jgi:hypothetical protein
MWATDACTNIFGTGCPCQTLPSRTERYGAFLQASCKLDGWKQALDAITVLYRRRDFCNMS